jgi:hypothetical protein
MITNGGGDVTLRHKFKTLIMALKVPNTHDAI